MVTHKLVTLLGKLQLKSLVMDASRISIDRCEWVRVTAGQQRTTEPLDVLACNCYAFYMQCTPLLAMLHAVALQITSVPILLGCVTSKL
jgi:hypothetical protein